MPASLTPLEEGTGPDLLHAGAGVVSPVPLDLPAYSYPEAERGSGKRARVRVALLVSEEGKVLQARVREGASAGTAFNDVALDAALKTRFQPATHDGLPGKMWTELLFDFEEPHGAPPPPAAH